MWWIKYGCGGSKIYRLKGNTLYSMGDIALSEISSPKKRNHAYGT